MNNRKTWLVFMTGPGKYQDLDELITPILKYFDGLVCVYHGEVTTEENPSMESWFLETSKKEGKVVYIPYSSRHDFSRNHYLYCGPIKNGDICVQIDDLERISGSFLNRNFAPILDLIEKGQANMFYYYGKPFIFQYHESLVYRGNPHEGLIREDGKALAVELSSAYPTEKDVRWNVRPEKRPDPYHFVNHYLKYYLFPWGSNHCLLGIEKNGDPNILFPIRARRQQNFRDELRKLNLEPTLEVVLGILKDISSFPTLKPYFEQEKILNDAYRYHILGDRTFKDNHDFKDIVPITL